MHLLVSALAIPLGAWVLWRPKGDRLHKAAGRAWSGLILLSCMSSLGLREDDGSFSYIHLLTLWSFFCISCALSAIKLRSYALQTATPEAPARMLGIKLSPQLLLRRHRNFMVGTYIGLIVAGVLAVLLPGRYLHTLLISPLLASL